MIRYEPGSVAVTVDRADRRMFTVLLATAWLVPIGGAALLWRGFSPPLKSADGLEIAAWLAVVAGLALTTYRAWRELGQPYVTIDLAARTYAARVGWWPFLAPVSGPLADVEDIEVRYAEGESASQWYVMLVWRVERRRSTRLTRADQFEDATAAASRVAEELGVPLRGA